MSEKQKKVKPTTSEKGRKTVGCRTFPFFVAKVMEDVCSDIYSETRLPSSPLMVMRSVSHEYCTMGCGKCRSS